MPARKVETFIRYFIDSPGFSLPWLLPVALLAVLPYLADAQELDTVECPPANTAPEYTFRAVADMSDFYEIRGGALNNLGEAALLVELNPADPNSFNRQKCVFRATPEFVGLVACDDPNDLHSLIVGPPDISDEGAVVYSDQYKGADTLLVSRPGDPNGPYQVAQGHLLGMLINESEQVTYRTEIPWGMFELRRTRPGEAPVVIASEASDPNNPADPPAANFINPPLAIDRFGNVFFQAVQPGQSHAILYGNGGPLSTLMEQDFSRMLISVDEHGVILLSDPNNNLIRRASDGTESVVQKMPFGTMATDLAACDIAMVGGTVCFTDPNVFCIEDGDCPEGAWGEPPSCGQSAMGISVWHSGALGFVVRPGTPMLGSSFNGVIFPPLINDVGQILFGAWLSDDRELLVRADPVGEDSDEDGVLDDQDNCPHVANEGQTDTNDDGMGDACQCGDVDGNGVLNTTDALLIARGQVTDPDDLARCDVSGDVEHACNTTDALLIARGRAPALPAEQTCPAYTGE
jgi:hypothetical protein